MRISVLQNIHREALMIIDYCPCENIWNIAELQQEKSQYTRTRFQFLDINDDDCLSFPCKCRKSSLVSSRSDDFPCGVVHNDS